MTPSGIDQSWGYADPAKAAAAGVTVVSMYLSNDPSKNVTPAKVRAYHQHGIGVLLNWESQAGAPLLGAAQGHADASTAVGQARALIKAVGYGPGNKPALLFSCDRDTTPAQYPAIDTYYATTAGVVHPAGFLNGVYGEANLVDHLHAKGLTDVEWQTYAWSGGRLSPEADFYQYLNGQTVGGASVDLDRVIHAAQLGAWWPPGSPLDTGDDMPLTDADIARIWAYPIKGSDGLTHPASTWLELGYKVGYQSAVALTDVAGGVLTRVAALQKAVAAQTATVDPVAIATAIRDRLLALIGAGQ